MEGDLKDTASGSILDSNRMIYAMSEPGTHETLFLQSSDHPMMTLVTSVLTSNDYLSWSHSIKIALDTKVKLGVFDGKCESPTENIPDYV